jgi:hypothetical protein
VWGNEFHRLGLVHTITNNGDVKTRNWKNELKPVAGKKHNPISEI